jgi:hypothetical protein
MYEIKRIKMSKTKIFSLLITLMQIKLMSFIYQYGCSDRDSLMLDSVNVSFGLRVYPKWLPAVTLTIGNM